MIQGRSRPPAVFSVIVVWGGCHERTECRYRAGWDSPVSRRGATANARVGHPESASRRTAHVVSRRDRRHSPSRARTRCSILSMAAGVNYNGVWAGLGKPVSVLDVHKHPFHIAGSDCAGIVWKVGSAVQRWKVGDEVVLHCNQTCGECAACNGYDPMGCDNQKIWGYETPYGSFAQFTLAQAQQLMPKGETATWEEAASYALDLCTAYRMLVDRANLRPGETVLVWGGAGGLGTFACQIARMLGATPIAVVSSEERGEMARRFGARRHAEPKGLPGAGLHAERDAGEEARASRRGEGVRQGVHEGGGHGPWPGRGVRAPGSGDVPDERLPRRPDGTHRDLRGDDRVRSRVRRATPVDAPEADHRLAFRARGAMLAGERSDRSRARSSRA